MEKSLGKKNIAVFISGRGSNLKSLINYSKKKNSLIKIMLVISNNTNAKGLKIANNFKIKNYVIKFKNRSIFEKHFPSDAAASSVPSVPSVACSTPTALEWDKNFKNLNDPSGRAIVNVHNKSY